MTWRAAYAVNLSPPLGMGLRAFGASVRAMLSSGSAPPVYRSPRIVGALPTLVLSPLMQRQALILDRDKAARMCRTQEVHRIEAQLRALTTKMLAKGSYSE